MFSQCIRGANEDRNWHGRVVYGCDGPDRGAVGGEELWEEFHKLLQETGRKLAELSEPGKASQ